MTIKEKMIDYIRRNRVSATEIADCLGKRGALSGIGALNPGHFEAGEIHYLFAVEESNWTVHEDLQGEVTDKIIFIDGIGGAGRAIIGDLVAKYILFYKENRAIVSNGKMRDAHTLVKENYPIWCSGVSPVGCFNRAVNRDAFREEIRKGREFYHGAIAVCDDSGVVVIPKEEITEEFFDAIRAMEEQEDIWYDCIDRRKWSTFRTICRKDYRKDDDRGRPL